MEAILLHQFHLVLSLSALPHVENIIILTGQTFVQNVFHYSKLPDVYDTTAWNNIQYTFFVSMFTCFLILSHFINYMLLLATLPMAHTYLWQTTLFSIQHLLKGHTFLYGNHKFYRAI